MTLNQFVTKYNGKGVDFDGSFGNQCVDLYRQYVKEVLSLPQSPPVVGAADVWDTYLSEHFERVQNTPSGVPQKGDIVIWGRTYGKFGHIAIFVEGDTKSLKCFSQNDPVGTLCQIQNYTSYKGVLGWLHAKNADIIEPVEPITDKTKINLGGEWGEMEVQAIRSTLSDMRRDITNARAELESTTFILQEERKRIITLEENNRELFLALEARIKQVSEMGEKLDALTEENEKLRSGVLPEPLFRIGRLVVYFSRV